MLSRADKIFIALIGAGLLSIYVGVVSMYVWLGLMLVRLFMLNRVELGIFSLMFGSSLFGRLFASDLLVVVLTTVFIILGYVLLRKEILHTIVRNRVSWLVFGAMIFYFVMMYLLGPMNSYATGKIARLVVRGITLLLMFQIYVQSKNVNNNHFAILFGLLAIFYLSQAYIVYGIRPSGLFDVSFFRDIAEEIGRDASGTSMVNTHTQGYLALGTLVFLISKKNLDIKAPWIIIFVAILALLILISGARQTMVATLGVLGLRIMLGDGNVIKNSIFALLCISAVAIGALNSGSSVVEKSKSGTNAGEVIHRDLDTPFRVMRVNPVFGVGFGGYVEYANKEYPHNMFFEIFSEYGLIGCIIFCIFFVISLCVCSIGFKYTTNSGVYFFLFLVVYSFRAMISGDLSSSIIIFSIILSFTDYSK